MSIGPEWRCHEVRGNPVAVCKPPFEGESRGSFNCSADAEVAGHRIDGTPVPHDVYLKRPDCQSPDQNPNKPTV